MAIEHLILPEPQNIKFPRRYSLADIGGIVTSMCRPAVHTMEPGQNDVTPESSDVPPYVQMLTVYNVGEAVLRTVQTRCGEAELAELTNNVLVSRHSSTRHTQSYMQVNRHNPVILQTLDGANDHRTSPIVGVVLFRPTS